MHEFVRNLLVGLSFFVVGMTLFMAGRHALQIWRLRHPWDVWWLMIYIGLANTVALIGELLFRAPGVPLTWRTASYAVGLAFIGIGTIGVASSVGRRDKRAEDE